MVMDAQPSPQCVGREFVRQYYTLLNKAPDHLHRFYNNSSSFVHGGLDASNRDVPMAIGQKQIHNKIQQLNFRDCHAKISQVDAQATLGGGVVVQVTGELSNAGQPMRRFTQTFVLAAQSPKKYYVHNDIFRYQDFYSEDDAEENGRSEVEEEPQEIESTVESAVLSNPPQTIYYSSNVLSSAPNVLPTFAQQPTQPPPPQQLNGLGHEEPTMAQTQTMPTMASNIDTNVSNQPAMEPEQPQFTEPEEVKSSEMSDPEEKDMYESASTDEKPEPIMNQAIANEPKTWSNLVKSGATSSTVMSFASSIGGSAPVNIMQPATVSSPPPAKFSQEQSTRFDPPLPSTGLSQKQPMAQRPIRERRTSNSNTTNQNQQFNDSQQLFLGNIPHHASEEELKTLFSRFGTVVDLRILSKQGQKIQGQRPPPNYGFITYEDSAAVQECLANLPLYFPDNSPDGQKLNVEEKKTRTRAPGETGGRIGSGNNYGNNMGNNLPRSMGTGPGQQNRNTQQRGNIGGGNIGQNRGGTFNRDRGGAPLGQRNNTGNMNAGNNGNTYNRR